MEKMKLVVDIGNTFVKSAVFSGMQMLELKKSSSFSLSVINRLLEKYSTIDGAILSSVRKNTVEPDYFSERKLRFIELDYLTPLPFTNQYATPETLGKDRMAAVAGAQALFPGHDILVIDTGTSITYDLLTANGIYLGGGISPGLRMRFEALHTLTGKLPLIETDYNKETTLIGTTTKDAIQSGVQNGVLQEVDGIIGQYRARFPGLKILICGGDNKYFDKYLKNNIFAAPNLVLQGLMKILLFNENS